MHSHLLGLPANTSNTYLRPRRGQFASLYVFGQMHASYTQVRPDFNPVASEKPLRPRFRRTVETVPVDSLRVYKCVGGLGYGPLHGGTVGWTCRWVSLPLAEYTTRLYVLFAHACRAVVRMVLGAAIGCSVGSASYVCRSQLVLGPLLHLLSLLLGGLGGLLDLLLDLFNLLLGLLLDLLDLLGALLLLLLLLLGHQGFRNLPFNTLAHLDGIQPRQNVRAPLGIAREPSKPATVMHCNQLRQLTSELQFLGECGGELTGGTYVEDLESVWRRPADQLAVRIRDACQRRRRKREDAGLGLFGEAGGP